MSNILSTSQTRALGSIFSKLGITEIPDELVHDETHGDLTEEDGISAAPVKPDKKIWKSKGYKTASEADYYTPELLKSGKVRVKIPDWLTSRVAECSQKYTYAKSWYSDINKMMNSILGSDDAMMALTILATTSPQMDFSENMLLSVKILHAFKLDMKNDPNKAWEFIDNIIPTLTEWERVKKTLPKGLSARDNADALAEFMNKKFSAYSELTLPRVVASRSLKATWVNTIAMLRYFKSVNYTINTRDLIRVILSQLNSGKLGDKISGNFSAMAELISTHKVWSFVLNLLDPDNTMTEVNYNSVGGKIDMGPLYPVTIDTWMIRFLYNRYDESDIDKIKSDIFSNNKSKYIGMVSTINKLSQSAGMKPDELQAVCWLASIDSFGINLDGKTPESALKKNIDKLKEEGDFYRLVSKTLSDMMNYIQASKESIQS